MLVAFDAQGQALVNILLGGMIFGFECRDRRAEHDLLRVIRRAKCFLACGLGQECEISREPDGVYSKRFIAAAIVEKFAATRSFALPRA